MRACRHLTVVMLTLALSAGNAAVCAGWANTPEARMDCCAKVVDCPGHQGSHHHSGARHVPTQAQADLCWSAVD